MPRGFAMIWEIEIQPLGADPERDRVAAEYDLMTHSGQGRDLFIWSSRGFLVEGKLTKADAQTLAQKLLVDSLVEKSFVESLGESLVKHSPVLTVLRKPGVMDPVAQSVLDAAADLNIKADTVRTFRRYNLSPAYQSEIRNPKSEIRKVLANDAIEQI